MGNDHLREACAAVAGWVGERASSEDLGLPPDQLVAHVGACVHCRGELVTLLADLLDTSAAVTDISCEDIENDLPAFVDYERSHGPLAVARAFPGVWWHTLLCPSCDEHYRVLYELAALPEQPWVAPTAIVRPRPRLLPRIEVAGDVIRQLLSLNRLGAAWSSQATDMVVADQQNELCLLQLLLRRGPDGTYSWVVRTHPPVEGVVVMTISGSEVRAAFDEQGYALFAGFSEEQMRAMVQGEVTLGIELHEAP